MGKRKVKSEEELKNMVLPVANDVLGIPSIITAIFTEENIDIIGHNQQPPMQIIREE